VLGGLIGYVQHRNATYQILGYSSTSLFARYDTAFNRVIGTFTSVNDPAILSVQPRRIDLVEVDRDQTLEQLARAHPSAVPVQQLAIINQVDGANSRIAAGSLFKRVI
jgi:predicted Zn-dependent protease